jgi:pimeloyl-ACP methyl ester carboxylesterase
MWKDFLMVAEASEGVVTLPSGRRVGYRARGIADGRPVMYLHGSPGSRREQDLIPGEVLVRFGVRLVSIDRPGYGETDPLAGDRVVRSADVISLCDELGIERCPIIAVSAGGSYALTVAAMAGDRIERVVLCCAQMPYDDEQAIQTVVPNKLGLIPLLRAGRSDQLLAGIGAFRDRLLADPAGGLKEISTLTAQEERWLELRHTVFADDVATGLARSAEGVVDDLLAWPNPFEIDPSRVRCPVRAVHGSIDVGEPLSNLQRVLALLPDTQLFLLDGLSHVGPLMYPDLLISLAQVGS